MDHSDGFVTGQTPVPVETTSAARRGPAAAPGVEMSHRHLITITIKLTFLTIVSWLIHCGRAVVEEICVSEHGLAPSQLLSATRPRRDQAAPRSATRASTAGRDLGGPMRPEPMDRIQQQPAASEPPGSRRQHTTPRPRKNGSSKTAGTPVRDSGRHGGRRAIGPGAGTVGPRAAGIRRGPPAAPWRARRGPVGFHITGGSPIQPEKATGASPIPLSPTTPSTTATCRPTSRCAPSGTPR